MTSNENQGLVTNQHKPTIIIRPARAGDRDFILSLVPRFVAFDLPKGRRKRACIAAIRADIERALRKTPLHDNFFIAVDANGKSVGFLRLQSQHDFFSNECTCHISDLAVASGHDGQGIGRALLDRAKQWAKASHCTRLTLSVFPGNARARALYEHAGFTDDLVRMAMPMRPASPRR